MTEKYKYVPFAPINPHRSSKSKVAMVISIVKRWKYWQVWNFYLYVCSDVLYLSGSGKPTCLALREKLQNHQKKFESEEWKIRFLF